MLQSKRDVFEFKVMQTDSSILTGKAQRSICNTSGGFWLKNLEVQEFRGPPKAPWWVEGNALVGGLGANGPQKLELFLKNESKICYILNLFDLDLYRDKIFLQEK